MLVSAECIQRLSGQCKQKTPAGLIIAQGEMMLIQRYGQQLGLADIQQRVGVMGEIHIEQGEILRDADIICKHQDELRPCFMMHVLPCFVQQCAPGRSDVDVL